MARSAKPGDHDKMAGLEQQLFLCNTGFACIPRCKPIRTVHAVAVLLAALLCPCVAVPSLAQTTPRQRESLVINHAVGPFDVKLIPQEDKTESTLGRMTIDKQYHGDLEGLAKGKCLPPPLILEDQAST